MTIEKGKPWGFASPLPSGAAVAHRDADVAAAWTPTAEHPPVVGLVGGDLLRTLGGHGEADRLFGEFAMTFPIDLGEVVADGATYHFAAHAVARTVLWGEVVAAMNAQWIGPWNAGPRAHPNDGVVDVYAARLSLGDRWKVRSRLSMGAHLPHPRIRACRSAEAAVEWDRPLPLYCDGVEVARASSFVFRAIPDALLVVV